MAGFFSKLMGKADSGNTPESAQAAHDNIDPFDRDYGAGEDRDSVIYQVSGMLLSYPTEETLDLLPEFTRLAQATENPDFVQAVQTVADWLTAREPVSASSPARPCACRA